MVYENFTTYSERGVDAGKLSQTAVRSTFASLERDDEAVLYKDFGIDHFTDFDIKLDMEVTALEAGDADSRDCVALFCLAENNNTVEEDQGNFIRILIRQIGDSDTTFVFRFGAYGAGVDDSTSKNVGTVYYLRIKRSGSTLTCDIYGSAANRDSETGALDNLSLTYGTAERYVLAPASQEQTLDGTDWISGYLEYLDLQEGLTELSSTFVVRRFFIWDVVVSPSSVQRSGTTTTELRCDWHDEDDLAAGAYTCRFWVRGPPPDEDEYGPFTGSVTKEGSKEYNATYDWDPPAGADLGLYDLKAEVRK